nr:hypothetical protein [Tanacetum cinerariifolium]
IALQTITDEHSAQLWEAFRGGEAQALATLFDAYYEALYHYGLKLTGDEELVKDCIQNLFQKLWRRREGLRAVQVQGDAEQSARLLAALNRLSKRQREALYLKFFDGFAYERIAEVMGLNTQSVRNLIFNALQVLRKVLAVVALLLCGLAA